jgi:DNA-directed RNA polymerase subunit M/transcription elongation factor TFIIS
MKFCPVCETYLVSEILSNDKEPNPNKLLLYKCYNCGHNEQIDVRDDATNKCIYKIQTGLNKIKIYSQNLKFLKYDATLPHIDNINCPNDKCPTKKEDLKNNVLYMNINTNMLIYLYQCCHCDYTWTNK